MATTNVVLDTASSSNKAALHPVAEAVLSKMAVVSDEVRLKIQWNQSIKDFANAVQGGDGDRGLGLVDLDLGHSTTCPVVLG